MNLCLNNKVVSIQYGCAFNGGKLGTLAKAIPNTVRVVVQVSGIGTLDD
jgi:hypothetical protein